MGTLCMYRRHNLPLGSPNFNHSGLHQLPWLKSICLSASLGVGIGCAICDCQEEILLVASIHRQVSVFAHELCQISPSDCGLKRLLELPRPLLFICSKSSLVYCHLHALSHRFSAVFGCFGIKIIPQKSLEIKFKVINTTDYLVFGSFNFSYNNIPRRI